MGHTLEVMDATGHLTLTWDESRPEELARARELVADLRRKGYRFYAVTPADTDAAFAAAGGKLIFEPVEGPPGLAAPPPPRRPGEAGDRDVVAGATPPAGPERTGPEEDAPTWQQRRARKGAATRAANAASRTVAVRPMRGG